MRLGGRVGNDAESALCVSAPAGYTATGASPHSTHRVHRDVSLDGWLASVLPKVSWRRASLALAHHHDGANRDPSLRRLFLRLMVCRPARLANQSCMTLSLIGQLLTNQDFCRGKTSSSSSRVELSCREHTIARQRRSPTTTGCSLSLAQSFEPQATITINWINRN